MPPFPRQSKKKWRIIPLESKFQVLDPEDLVSKSEAALLLEISPSRLSQYIGEGFLIPVGDGMRAKLKYGDVIDFKNSGKIKRQTKSFRSGSPGGNPIKDRVVFKENKEPPPPLPPRSKKLSEERTNLEDFRNSDGGWDIELLRVSAEFEKFRKLQVERLAEEGRYLEVTDVEPAWARALASINQYVMTIPSRLKSDNPEISLEVIEQLEVLCRDVLKSAAGELKKDAN
jgi:hypothetical protein